MSPFLAPTAFIRFLDTEGLIMPLGQLLFYYTGGLIEAPVYDADGDEFAQPVLADLTGAFPSIYTDPQIVYRVRLLNADGVEEGDVDPYPEFSIPWLVTPLSYGAQGDGVTDDSAAIQACIDANKGKNILYPAPYVFLCAGITLSGSTYNGTRLVIEGTLKLKVKTAANFLGITYGGLIFQNCSFSLSVPGVIDGNRAAQPDDPQTHCIIVAGCTNWRIEDGWRVKEVRGDGLLMILQSSTSGANNDRFYVGTVEGYNSADDGRNCISLVAGINGEIAGGISSGIGGTVNAERQPGGFNCEGDPAEPLQLISNVHIGPWEVKTAGTSGFCIIGQSISGVDASMDWTVTNITFDPFIVTQTSNSAGAPIIRRSNGGLGSGIYIKNGTRQQGIDCDYLNNWTLDFPKISGVTDGVVVGGSGTVYDSQISANVADHSGSAMLVTGVQRSKLKLRCRSPQGAGSYGFNIDNGVRTITQVGVEYTIDCPYDANLTVAVRCDGISYGEGTRLVGGSLTGFTLKATQLGTTDANILRSEMVEGRNTGAAAPTEGTFADGDAVKNTAPAAAGAPGWVCTTPGFTGTFVFKAMAALAA